MKNRLFATLFAAVVLATAGPAAADSTPFVAGQKLDSGLGELPHYSKWANPRGRMPVSVKVLGESLDSGLGTLPHYSKWLDRSGKNPMGEPQVLLSQASR